MSRWNDRAWRRAMGTAALLFVSGAVMGILVDRHWLAPPDAEATPLTADAMVARLGLSPAEETRVRGLLDSLHAEILQKSPDSLPAAVAEAQRRIEAALPADVRPGFRAWMEEHHQRFRHRMHGPAADHGMMHR
jgi:hypothetical protein